MAMYCVFSELQPNKPNPAIHVKIVRPYCDGSNPIFISCPNKKVDKWINTKENYKNKNFEHGLDDQIVILNLSLSKVYVYDIHHTISV